MQTLLIATSNPGKLREVTAILAGLPIQLTTLRDFPNLPPAVEDGDTFQENARRKAIHYASHTGLWTLADDSGLEVDALGGAPGVYSARYAGEEATDAANNAKLIAQLADVPPERRTARFRCVIAVARPTPLRAMGSARSAGDSGRASLYEAEVLATATGAMEGAIVDDPRGSNGFGYDPHFFVQTLGMTSAQLPPELKNAVSHRAKALQAIAPEIKRLLR